jgi:hypothetical protein
VRPSYQRCRWYEAISGIILPFYQIVKLIRCSLYSSHNSLYFVNKYATPSLPCPKFLHQKLPFLRGFLCFLLYQFKKCPRLQVFLIWAHILKLARPLLPIYFHALFLFLHFLLLFIWVVMFFWNCSGLFIRRLLLAITNWCLLKEIYLLNKLVELDSLGSRLVI